MSKDPRLLKLSGTEFTTALMEEADELEEQVYNILTTRVGRWKNTDYNIPPYIQINCNPNKTWVKKLFYDKHVEGQLKAPYYFLQALTRDNPYHSQEYLDALERLPEDEKQRLMYGRWEFMDNPNQLIQYLWIKNQLNEIRFEDILKQRKSKNDIALGVDVARYGDDATSLCYIICNHIARFETYRKKDTNEIAEIVALRMKEYEILPHRVGIDTVGIGSGTYDALKKMGKKCIEFNSGHKATEKANVYHSYKNLRGQAHWELREDIRTGLLTVYNNTKFIEEATNINYEIKNNFITIEEKEDMKKRLGHSPDLLDSAKIANHIKRRKTEIKVEDIFVGKQLQSVRLLD